MIKMIGDFNNGWCWDVFGCALPKIKKFRKFHDTHEQSDRSELVIKWH